MAQVASAIDHYVPSDKHHILLATLQRLLLLASDARDAPNAQDVWVSLEGAVANAEAHAGSHEDWFHAAHALFRAYEQRVTRGGERSSGPSSRYSAPWPAQRALLTRVKGQRSFAGHSIAAARALKSGLWVHSGRKRGLKFA